MQCPVCEGIDLAMSNREGIEIDYCPKCRGVWLDRGELDKIIERSAPATPAQPAYQDNHRPSSDYQEKHYSSDKYGNQDHYKRKKKKSLLGELFDF